MGMLTVPLFEKDQIRSQRNLVKGKLRNISEESGWDEKDEDIPEEITLAKTCTLKEILEVFHNVEGVRDKRLGAETNLERSVTIQ